MVLGTLNVWCQSSKSLLQTIRSDPASLLQQSYWLESMMMKMNSDLFYWSTFKNNWQWLMSLHPAGCASPSLPVLPSNLLHELSGSIEKLKKGFYSNFISHIISWNTLASSALEIPARGLCGRHQTHQLSLPQDCFTRNILGPCRRHTVSMIACEGVNWTLKPGYIREW